MRILHVSDIHGNFSDLERVIGFSDNEGVDVFAFTGDLIGPAVSMEEAQAMNRAAAIIEASVRVEGQVSFSDLVRHLASEPKVSKQLREIADTFLQIEKKYDDQTNLNYIKAREIFAKSKFPQLTIPGNWENLAYAKIFSESDLHRKTKEISGIRFAGYGLADARHIQTPLTRFLSFDEDKLFEFLSQSDPDVALVHVPPKKVLDRFSINENNYLEIGSYAVRSYLAENSPALLLCGHAHDNLGAFKFDGDTGTVIVNSGHLSIEAGKPSTFSIIGLGENDYVTSTDFYKLNGNGIERIKE